MRNLIIGRATALNNQTQFISHDAETRKRFFAISTRWIFLALEIECGTQSPFVASTKSVTPTHRLTITANRGCEYASIGPGKVVAVCGTLQAMQHGLPHRLIDFAPADELEDAEIFRLSRSCSMKLLLFGIWHANRLMTSAMRGRRQDFLPNFQASVFPRIFFFLLSFPPNGIARRCTFAHTLLAFWNNVYQYF